MIRVFPVKALPEGEPDQNPRTGRPCVGPGRVWYRDDFEDPRRGGRYRHHATDLFALEGSPVLAPEDGEVYAVKLASEGGDGGDGGNAVRVFCPQSGRRYYFSHLSEPPVVQVGERVVAGQVIGKVGRTGNAEWTCPHLHLGIRRAWRTPSGRVREGRAINPFPELVAVDPTKGHAAGEDA